MAEWNHELQQRGVYWEGWVEDIDRVLSDHGRATVTTFGTRRSKKLSGSADKENSTVSWINSNDKTK